MKSHVVVVGCGLAGLFTAYHLIRLGFKPTVISQDEAFGCSTDAAQGICSNKGLIIGEQLLFRLKLEGHFYLKNLLKNDDFLKRRIDVDFGGSFEPFADSTEYEAIMKRVYRGKNQGLSLSTVHCPLPGQQKAEVFQNQMGLIHYASDYWLDVQQLKVAMSSYVSQSGGSMIEGSVSVDGAKKFQLRRKASDEIELIDADHLILCTGVQSHEILAQFDYHINLINNFGCTLRAPLFRHQQSPMSLVAGRNSCRIGEREIILGSTSHARRGGLNPQDLKNDHMSLFDSFEKMGLRADFKPDFGSIRFRSGVRIRTKDRLPVVGCLRHLELSQKMYIFTGLYKNGLQVSGLIGRELAQMVAGGPVAPFMRYLAPERFVKRTI